MEECPPGGDYGSGEGDPSQSDSSPAGEQAQGSAQGKNVSRGDDASQPASHSPELKRKKVSSTTSGMSKGDDGSQPAFHSPELKRKKVSSTTSGPMVEWHQAALVALQGSLKLNVKMIQLSDMLERPAGGFMDRAEALSVKAKTGDMEQMGELINILLGKEDMAFYAFCDLLERSNYEVWAHELKSAAERLKTVEAPNEGSQTARRISVSKTTTPGMAIAVNPSPDVSALSLESCKMDIVSCDVNVFESHKSPADAIRSLYFNAYNHLIRILSNHRGAIKSVALSAVRTKQVSATEVEVKEACDLRALFECLEVDKKWNDLEFLSTAVMSLPMEASKEKGVAQVVLGQYKSYLTHYMKAVTIKEGKSALSFLQRKRGREERMVVSEITIDKEIDEYTCRDLLDLWKLFLIETLEIPEDRIEYRLARAGNSTTLVFMITLTYAEGIKKKLSKPAAVWVMKELRILRVYVAGVVSVDLREVLPNVPIASIREGLKSGVDFVSLTKVSPPLMCSLLDQVSEPKETQVCSSIQPYSAGPAELSVQEPPEDAASSASVVKDLLVAAAEGRLHEVQSLLDRGRCRVNDENEEGQTAILTAAFFGHLTVLRTLVEQYGGNVLNRLKGGLNAFHLSAEGGHVGVAQYLAPMMGVHMFDLTDGKETALHRAAMNGHMPMVEHLVKSAGFDVKVKNQGGGTPFLIAAAMGHVEVAGFLLDNGSSILERDDGGFNAFHLSADGGHVRIAQYLAPMMGVHMFDLTDEKETALHRAARNGHLPMVEHLVKSAGFDVKDKNKYGDTPFLTAVAWGHVEVAGFLLDNGSSILERRDNGFNAYHLSAEGGHVGVAQYLAPMMGVHMFDLTDAKATALHMAAGHGHLPMVEHLVKNAGFGVKDKDKNGATPFLLAAKMGHVEIAGFLLDNGSSILERADYKETALHLAAQGGHLNMVKFLVPQFGVRVYEKNFFRETCSDLAEAKGHRHVVEYLDSDFPTLKAKGCSMQ